MGKSIDCCQGAALGESHDASCRTQRVDLDRTRGNARLREERLKTQAIVQTYERRIGAQKQTINRLLGALNLLGTKDEQMESLVRQLTEAQDEMLLHKATTQRIIDLLRAEEGARVINVDLLQAIIDEGAEQEKIRREAHFNG